MVYRLYIRGIVMDSQVSTAKRVNRLNLEDEHSLEGLMTEIRNDPILAQRYVQAMVDLKEDNEHKFSIIERDMFVAMKVLFDVVYEQSISKRNSSSMEPKDYQSLVRLVKDMYQTLTSVLGDVKVKVEKERKFTTLTPIEIVDETTEEVAEVGEP